MDILKNLKITPAGNMDKIIMNNINKKRYLSHFKTTNRSRKLKVKHKEQIIYQFHLYETVQVFKEALK